MSRRLKEVLSGYGEILRRFGPKWILSVGRIVGCECDHQAWWTAEVQNYGG
jgi:hypothetical protein